MKPYGYIYKIVCKINNKAYIGQTIQSISQRWNGHRSDALNYKKYPQHKFYNAIRKYGIENFTISIVCIANNKEELDNREKACIRLFKTIKNGYNFSEGGLSQRHSLETRLKMSLASKGKKKPEGFAQKLREANIGKKKPEWILKKMRECQKGEKSVWFGRKHTEEEKRKISEGQKGKKLSAEHVQKIKDRVISEETRFNMSMAAKNRKEKRTSRARKIICVDTGVIYNSIKEAYTLLNISSSYLSKHMKGKYKSVKGLIFKYL